MPRKKKPPPPAPSAVPPAAPSPPQIHEATLLDRGAVQRGRILTQAEAEARRRAGGDVVVCGPDLAANRRLAGEIERNATGPGAKRDPPHLSAGPNALPHYQPDPRPPDGHTFYETPNLKAL
jgi:hypothetical protein